MCASYNNRSSYTAEVLARVAEYKGTTEWAIVRELCGVYDYMCDCPATAEARQYIRQRIEAHEWIMRQNEQ